MHTHIQSHGNVEGTPRSALGIARHRTHHEEGEGVISLAMALFI